MSNSQYDFSRRQEWIDALRGFAILLVIASHISSYFSDILSGYALHSHFSKVVDAIGPLRMEALFFLSGMLVYRSAKKGRKAYIHGKVNAVLWPYVVWTVVMLVLGYNNFSNNIGPALYGFSQSTWFLAFLFTFYLVSDVTRSIDFRIVLLVAYCLAIVLFITGSPVDRNFVKLWDLPYYYLFFRCGDQLVRSETAVELLPQPLRNRSGRDRDGLGNGNRGNTDAAQDTPCVLSRGISLVPISVLDVFEHQYRKISPLCGKKLHLFLRCSLSCISNQ